MGFKRCIGSDWNTKVWTEPWIDVMPLNHWPTYVNVDFVSSLSSVADLTDENEWNLDKLNVGFHPILVKRILGNMLSQGPR